MCLRALHRDTFSWWCDSPELRPPLRPCPLGLGGGAGKGGASGLAARSEFALGCLFWEETNRRTGLRTRHRERSICNAKVSRALLLTPAGVASRCVSSQKTQPSQRIGKGKVLLARVKNTRDISQSSVTPKNKIGEVLSLGYMHIHEGVGQKKVQYGLGAKVTEPKS